MRFEFENHIGKIALGLLAIFAILTIGMDRYIARKTTEHRLETTVEHGQTIAQQFKTIRGYYTKNVVKPVKAASEMKIHFDHSGDDTVIPLPATMIHDLSRLFAEDEDGTQVNLYSSFPFPNRKQRRLDEFQRDAIAFLGENPGDVFHRSEDVDGHPRVRVAVADLMVNSACVSCHNTHPDTPKNNWAVGDVRGVLEVSMPIGAEMTAQAEMGAGIKLMTVSFILLIGLFIGATMWMVRRIHERGRVVVDAIDQAAAGDLLTEVPVQGEGEGVMGRIASGFNSLIRSLRGSVDSMSAGSGSLVESSSMLRRVGDEMGANATETANQAKYLSAASQQMSNNVQSVASSIGQLKLAVEEISQNTTEAATVASTAVVVAQGTNETVSKLGESSAEIGDVVKLITSIAEQTNLLALNATIEAARAGEAGKGFAVVANEVKELAKQTAKATDEIGHRVEAIRSDSHGAVEAIEKITSTIAQISEYQNSIATAVEEQTAMTQEIGRSVSDAADGSLEIAKNIEAVSGTAHGTSEGVQEMLDTVESLVSVSDDLEAAVGRLRSH